MKILVTGGAGFIGSHVTDRLLAMDHEVTVLDDFNDYYNPAFKRANLVSARKNPRFRMVEGDVARMATLRAIFSESKPDMVIHLAARAGVRASLKDPFLYQRVNVEGTLNVLECARAARVTKLAFGSTSSVYGLNTKLPFSETDSLLNIVSPYSATKLAGEALCRAYSHLYKMDIAVFRFFTVYGPRGRPDMVIYQFSEKILADQPIPVFGDGSSQRDYTYVDDIVQGVTAATNREFGFEIFNLGESETTSLNDLIHLLEKNLGRQAKIQRLTEQPGDVPRTFADITKARHLLGYDPQTKIAEGIPKFTSWFRKERA
ncbi:MAG: GDP-mannose 4,6-dehydratase [Verrucomicrobia bacterium]|nr:GDP-mannose 4,6-dehydratase [Verrucomicrobiota bacterium]